MAYTALEKMRTRNAALYGIDDSAKVPPLSRAKRNYGREALKFIREDCENLKLDLADSTRAALDDNDGCSAAPGQIPYNMERDLDRLCLETAIARFLETGSREDAFDIYYCYNEIFKPLGEGSASARLLLEMLSEHEENASSLMMKHRDHYSHSVYVFLIGLAIYRNCTQVQQAYRAHFGLLEDEKTAACHFLEFWGLTSLFHDIGYPFEIAHQQMKAYVCKLDARNNDSDGFAPYVSYRNMGRFVENGEDDLDAVYAKTIAEHIERSYLADIDMDVATLEEQLLEVLRDRAVHKDPAAKSYLYMDHAYFSGLMMMKAYLNAHSDVDTAEIPDAVIDAFCAIIMHNSLFKFQMRGIMGTKKALSLVDSMPLAYMLMLCDELQCWDRASYGQNSRGGVYPFDFDIMFANGKMTRWFYFFDETYRERIEAAKSYREMQTVDGRCPFVDDIDNIVQLDSVVAGFIEDRSEHETSGILETILEPKQRRTGQNLSDTNYLNLYNFAVELAGYYAGAASWDEKVAVYEDELSLEYKLSNIAQAKGFADQLQSIQCFYADRPVDFEPVTDFRMLIQEPGHENDLDAMAAAEHGRWCREKLAMGWQAGTAHVKPQGNDNIMRERTRIHHDLVGFDELSEEEKVKDSGPMMEMLDLVQRYDGLTVYRLF